jgi:phosphatidylethanolamine-binding protein (PEBP) family uncharacterized protein
MNENHPPYGAGHVLANDTGHPRYDGPCPPRGDGQHLYRFTLYALDVPVLHFRGDSRSYFDEALDSHVLATATLRGGYERKSGSG